MDNVSIDNVTLISSLAILLSPFFLKKLKMSVGTISGIATSLGILGTFAGIFIGLIYFDVNNIAESVPQLLEGLKTAFLTSIAGLVASLILKTCPILYGIKASNGPAENPDVERIVNSIEKIEKSISGDGETTLITQIQKLRTNTNDGLDTLNKSFREFADRMVADSTQSLIEALENVMRDFNTKINEQFGDNFKQLNEAVGKMLDWQMAYSESVDEMTLQFRRTLEGVAKCESLLSDISSKTLVYQNTAENLQQTLAGLFEGIATIRDIGKEAKTVLPEIQRTIKNLTENFAHEVSASVRENEEMMKSQRTAIDAQINGMASFYDRLNSHQRDLFGKLKEDVNTLMRNNSEKIAGQIVALDAGLSEELRKALNTLGDTLAALSTKFVKDYDLFASNLQRYITVANNSL
jgi:uncharacterized coiled-coil DUF342 family protein